jgi:hypothetical protein
MAIVAPVLSTYRYRIAQAVRAFFLLLNIRQQGKYSKSWVLVA